MDISINHCNFNRKFNKPLQFQWIFVCPTGHWARIWQPEFRMMWAWSAHIRHRFPYVEFSMEISINQRRSANTGHNFAFRCNQPKSAHTRHCVSELIRKLWDSASRASVFLLSSWSLPPLPPCLVFSFIPPSALLSHLPWQDWLKLKKDNSRRSTISRQGHDRQD